MQDRIHRPSLIDGEAALRQAQPRPMPRTIPWRTLCLWTWGALLAVVVAVWGGSLFGAGMESARATAQIGGEGK